MRREMVVNFENLHNKEFLTRVGSGIYIYIKATRFRHASVQLRFLETLLLRRDGPVKFNVALALIKVDYASVFSRIVVTT